MDTGEYQLEFEPAPNGGDMTLFLSREVKTTLHLILERVIIISKCPVALHA